MQTNINSRPMNQQPGYSSASPISSVGMTHHHGQPNTHENEVLRNLMINYIPTQVEESYLRQMFEAYGPVESVKIVYDKENNMSKGYGFVKYRSIQSASLAISNLNGYPILNKRLKVAYAKADEAQRMLQQMQLDTGVNQVGAMDPNQMQWMYYMQLQAQQQQMWMQQMQQMMLNQGTHSPSVSTNGTSANVAGTAQGLTAQQQMMMLVQGQQGQASAQVAPNQH